MNGCMSIHCVPFWNFSIKGSILLKEVMTHWDAGRRPSIDASRRLQQPSVKTSHPPRPITPRQNTTFYQHKFLHVLQTLQHPRNPRLRCLTYISWQGDNSPASGVNAFCFGFILSFVRNIVNINDISDESEEKFGSESLHSETLEFEINEIIIFLVYV
jgi:hypothetical protein